MNKMYHTDLTDSQWEVIGKFLNLKRKRKHCLRIVWNTILYITKTGCQWRLLPHDLIPWESAYYYFRVWKQDGTFEQVMEALRQHARQQANKSEAPSIAICDSQSVKMLNQKGQKGVDGYKKIKGRKRNYVVDSCGYPLGIEISSANTHDAVAVVEVLPIVLNRHPSIKQVWADDIYHSDVLDEIAQYWSIEWIIQPKISPGQFQVQPIRWRVERSFAWLQGYRRLNVDMEVTTESALAFNYLAFISILAKKCS